VKIVVWDMTIVRRMQKIVVLLVGAIFVTAGSAYCAGWEYISPARVHSLLNEGSGLWLLDIRGGAAFDRQHIEGAINVPLEELSVKNFPQQKMLVLVDDAIGLKGALDAAVLLSQRGYKKVYILDGGLWKWNSERYPVVGSDDGLDLVTARELRWVIENKVRVKIYDLRDEQEVKKTGTVPGAEAIKGKDLNKRVGNLSVMLKKGEKKGLAAKLDVAPPVVVVLPQGVDPVSVLIRIEKGNTDLRYLDGGYEAWVSEKSTKTVGSCPVCSARKKEAVK